MRIALLAPGYPSPERHYNYAFVHARAKLYQARGAEVVAFSLGRAARRQVFEGVDVVAAPWRELASRIRAFNPAVVAVHAPSFRVIDVAEALDVPQVAWIHGHEALYSGRMTRESTSLGGAVASLFRMQMRNAYQWLRLRRYLGRGIPSVFVSRWMREAAEHFLRSRVKQAAIIPNPVDVQRFAYGFSANHLERGVCIRSLENSKYGVDLAIRAFADVREAHLTIIGRGQLARRYRELADRVGANVTIREASVAHEAMPTLLSEFGFFVAPSRVEAQGVAMCEAMSVGLPVVATRVGGIPEFVTDGLEGYLCEPESPEAIEQAVKRLLASKEIASRLSTQARERMMTQCSPSVVVTAELAVLQRASRGLGGDESLPELGMAR